MIKAIIFDAFDTLFEVKKGGSANLIRGYINSCGHNVEEEAINKEWKAFYKEKTSEGSAFLTEREIFTSRIKMFYDRYDVKKDAVLDVEAILLPAYNRKAFVETNSVLQRLRKKYKVFIGSNTDNDVINEVIEKNKTIVDYIYTSENLQCYKPNPMFYNKILSDNGLNSNEVIFVGDSLSDDVYGPSKVGIKAVWLNRNNNILADNVPEDAILIHNLNELLGMKLEG